MPLNIRSEEVNRLAETLAARKHINRTDAVKQALENELRRLDQVLPLREAEAALDAFSGYGKGRGHPAQLNLGDCFAYAVARTYQTALLFKGEDFDKTDIRSAMEARGL